MSCRLVIRPRAETDITEAALWYQKQSPGLEEAFLLELDAALRRAVENPLTFVPGLIYNLWRFSTRRNVCAVCKSDSLVPLHSPRGSELLARYHGGQENKT